MQSAVNSALKVGEDLHLPPVGSETAANPGSGGRTGSLQGEHRLCGPLGEGAWLKSEPAIPISGAIRFK